MMQMTSYLHHYLILMIGTYSEIFVKIRHDDVILRDVTSFRHFGVKTDEKSADVSKTYP